MTENDAKTPQDFRAAFHTVAAMVRADFQAKDIRFADTSTSEGRAIAAEWFAQGGDASQFRRGPKSGAEHITGKNGDLVIVETDAVPLIVSQDPYVNVALVTAHEAWHGIAEKGHAPRGEKISGRDFDAAQLRIDEYQHEIAADVPAISYLVSKNVPGVRMEHIDTLALNRAIGACLGDTPHNTALALDTLRMEYAEDAVRAMKPDDIKNLANAFAERFTTTEDPREQSRFMKEISPMPGDTDDLAAFMDKAGQSTWQKWLKGLADHAVAADPSAETFYPAARVVSEVLATGALQYPEPRRFDVTGAFWDNARDVISYKALEIGMEKTLAPFPRKPRGPGI